MTTLNLNPVPTSPTCPLKRFCPILEVILSKTRAVEILVSAGFLKMPTFDLTPEIKLRLTLHDWTKSL